MASNRDSEALEASASAMISWPGKAAASTRSLAGQAESAGIKVPIVML